MPQKRTAAARQTAAARSSLNQEIAGVVVAATGAWLFLAVAGSGGGQLGDTLGRGVRALVGGAAAWLVPAALVALGLYLIIQRQGFRMTRRLWGLTLLILVFIVGMEVYTYPYPPSYQGAVSLAGQVQDIENARDGFGGGLVGHFLGQAVTLFGLKGRWVVMVALGLIGFVLTTELSLADILRWFGHRAKTTGQAVAAGAAATLARREAAAPSRPAGVRPDAVAAVSTGRGKATTIPARTEPVPAGAEQPRSRFGFGGGGREVEPASEQAVGRQPEQPLFKIHLAGQTAGGTSGALLPARTGGAAPAAGAIQADSSGEVAAEPAAADPAPAEASDAAESKPRRKEAADSRLRLVRQGDQWQTSLDTDAAVEREYRLPPLELLRKGQQAVARDVHQDIMERARHLEEVLSTYGVPAKVVEVHQGPAITRFELTVEAGTKISKVTSLADDLAYHLAAPDVRIEAPIPGKRAIGIEVPNQEVNAVYLRDVLETPEFLQNPSKLTVALGKDIAGGPIVGTLERFPHVLIAGATGSGKSVCMNGLICSLLVKARPDEVKMLMIDPKRVELAMYDGIPHLMAPVCTDPKKAAGYLKWAVKEMENRYDLFAATGVRNITHYNEWVRQNPVHEETGEERKPLPYVVIFIDELADLMMVAPVDVEDSICRLAQMARACGMHLVVATQRPSVDVITGLIKANIPSRIAFATSSAIDSRTILDMGGAEKLLGKGDMLYHPSGASKPVRAQGAFLSDKEAETLVRFVKQQGKPVYFAESLEGELTGKSRGGGGSAGAEAEKDARESAVDAIFAQAVRVVIEHGQASVSILQRRLRCNYTKAARLIDMMEERGWIGPHQGPKPRDVLITMPQWDQLFGDTGDAETAATEDE